MKKIFLLVPAAILMLTGCQNNTQPTPSNPVMTQSIINDDMVSDYSLPLSETEEDSTFVQSSSADAQPAKEVAPETSSHRLPVNTSTQAASESYDELLQKYCAIKAEADAVDVEQDILESDYRIGKIDSAAFQAKKTELRNQEDSLDLQKDQQKLALYQAIPQRNLPNGSMEELKNRLRQLELTENELEVKEDRLEEDYRLGAVSREEFIIQQTELLILDEKNDYEKDLVEDALELLGWDD